MAFDLGSLLGSVVTGGLGFFGQSQANAQNMTMNTGAWKANQLQAEASLLGVSPLSILGSSTAPTPSQNVFGDAPALGQNIARSVVADSGADARLNALKEQNLMLQNQQLENDVVAGYMRNSINRVSMGAPGTSPPAAAIPMPMPDPRFDPEIKPMLQRFRGTTGVVYAPSGAVQQSLWSPLPGLPANPAVIADVVRANASGIPPDVARMSGLPPGAYPFVPGTADWSWSNLLPDWR